ncbi:MAG: hypothetical protein OHK0017_01450 [Patescibacteria group bacterium]
MFKSKFGIGLIGAILILVSVIGAAIGFTGSFYDLSYDGQAYHQEAIIMLSEGWNPLQKQLSLEDTPHYLWLNHYSKMPWLLSVSVYNLTSNIEAGKIFGILFLLASFCFAVAALIEFKRWSLGATILFALLLAFNPVSLYQSSMFYVDGQLASLMLILLSCLCLVFLKSKWVLGYLLTCIAGILIINIKLTAVAYLTVLLLAAFILILVTRNWRVLKRLSVAVILMYLAGFMVLGFNPFITNWQIKGNPFFPILGEGAINLKPYNVPVNYTEANTLEILILSPFFASSEVKGPQGPAELKVPFTVSDKEMQAFRTDPFIGGFGPWFGGAVGLAVIMLLVLLGISFYKEDQQARRRLLIFVLFAGAVIGSSLLNYAPSYARYVPQLWLLPVLVVILVSTWKNWLATIASLLLSLILLVNIGIVGYAHIDYMIKGNQEFNQKLEYLQGRTNREDVPPVPINFNLMRSTKIKLEQHNVKYLEVRHPDYLPCDYHTMYYFPSNESDVCYW